MQRKSCSVCGIPANISLCFLASTVGQSPRKQGAAKVVLFCKACLEASLSGQQPKGFSGLHQPVSEAWSALSGACTDGRGLVERAVGLKTGAE
jgi:hypothetical protein